MRFSLPALLACCLLLGGPVFADDADDGPTLSLSFEETPIQEIVATIARFAGANVILPADLDAKVTVTLHDVPFRAALEQIAQIAGCTLVEEDHGILRLVPAAESEAILRIYDVSDLLRDEALVLPLSKDLGIAEVQRTEGNLIVSATPEVQANIERELERLRYERARKEIGFDFQLLVSYDVSGMPLLAPLARALETRIFATHQARELLRQASVSPEVIAGLTPEEALHRIARRARIAWARSGGVVHLLAPGESPDETVAVFTADSELVSGSGWSELTPYAGRRNATSTGDATGLEARLDALQKELRALRAEVAEIKALLLRDDR